MLSPAVNRMERKQVGIDVDQIPVNHKDINLNNGSYQIAGLELAR